MGIDVKGKIRSTVSWKKWEDKNVNPPSLLVLSSLDRKLLKTSFSYSSLVVKTR